MPSSHFSADKAYSEGYLWRTGRKVGRTIYAVVGEAGRESDNDVLIGVMDTPELADEAVRAHNEDVMNEHLGESGGT